jgi:hypothetical protein
MTIREDAAFPDFFSPPLRSLLSLMLIKNRFKRSTITDILGHSWIRLLASRHD